MAPAGLKGFDNSVPLYLRDLEETVDGQADPAVHYFSIDVGDFDVR